MNLSDQGVVLAFTIGGVSAGFWAAFVTWQLRGMRREIHDLRASVTAIIAWLRALGVESLEDGRGPDRHSRRVLDDPPAGVSGIRRPVR